MIFSRKAITSLGVSVTLLFLVACTEASKPVVETPVSPGVETPSAETAVDEVPKTESVFEGPGNSPSNLLAHGMAVEDEGYLYHIDKMLEGSIWKTSKSDGSSELLLKGQYTFLNISGSHLFMYGLDEGGILDLNLDNKETVMLKEGFFGGLVLQDEWLYYADSFDGGLYRMKYDGSEDTLIQEGIFDDYAIDGETIYFLTSDYDEDGSYVYKIPLEGGTPEKCTSRTFGGFFTAADGYVYYEPAENGTFKFKRVRADGTDDSVLLEKSISYPNVSEGWLYYYTGGRAKDKSDSGFYRIRLDGTEDTLITQGVVGFDFNIAGDKIFFHTNDDQRRLTVMNLDGSEMRFLEIEDN